MSAGLHPRPTQARPDPLAGLEEAYFEGMGRRRKGREDRQGRERGKVGEGNEGSGRCPSP